MTLRVTLEIVPYGDETRKRVISRLDIFNMGRASGEDVGVCEYGIIHIDNEKNTAGLYEETVLHQVEHGAWDLIENALRNVVSPFDYGEDEEDDE